MSGSPKASTSDSDRPQSDEFEQEPARAAEAEASPTPGSAPLIASRYRLVRELGAGGQGHTFLARDEHRNREVAVKRFDLRTATDWKKVELFERECSVLRAIEHPAIPRYLDHFEQDGVFYLVMERVVGESLQERRTRGIRMTEAEIWRVLDEVGAILDMLHGLQPPVIHRDIKPHNLLRRPDGTIALVDFGAVRDMMRAGGGSTVAGTFGYMAPEQLHGQALAQTDIYGLGATLVALMTGREPEQLKHKGLRVDVRSEVSASPALIGVLERMLEPDPDHRPRSARAAMGRSAPRMGPEADTRSASRVRVASEPTAPPRSHNAPQAESTVEPRSPSVASDRLETAQPGGLEAFCSAMPFPLSLALSLGILMLSVPFWILGSIIFPALSLVFSGGPGGSMKGAARWSMNVQGALAGASSRASRAASGGYRVRSETRMRKRVDRRLMAKRERERLRQQAAELKRTLRDKAREHRRRF